MTCAKRSIFACASCPRALVEARYEDGATIDNVAKAFRRSAGAVTQALFRIRSALWNCVEREMKKVET